MYLKPDRFRKCNCDKNYTGETGRNITKTHSSFT